MREPRNAARAWCPRGKRAASRPGSLDRTRYDGEALRVQGEGAGSATRDRERGVHGRRRPRARTPRRVAARRRSRQAARCRARRTRRGAPRRGRLPSRTSQEASARAPRARPRHALPERPLSRVACARRPRRSRSHARRASGTRRRCHYATSPCPRSRRQLSPGRARRHAAGRETTSASVRRAAQAPGQSRPENAGARQRPGTVAVTVPCTKRAVVRSGLV